MFILVDDRYILDTACICSACEYCENLSVCVEHSLKSVLPETDCVLLLHHFGCAGTCKECFVPKEETDNYCDY